MVFILLSKADKDLLLNCRSITVWEYLGKGQTSGDGSSRREGWANGLSLDHRTH